MLTKNWNRAISPFIVMFEICGISHGIENTDIATKSPLIFEKNLQMQSMEIPLLQFDPEEESYKLLEPKNCWIDNSIQLSEAKNSFQKVFPIIQKNELLASNIRDWYAWLWTDMTYGWFHDCPWATGDKLNYTKNYLESAIKLVQQYKVVE